MRTDDTSTAADRIQAENAAVRTTASSTIPDEMEAAVARPRKQGACIFDSNFGYQVFFSENGNYLGDVVWVTDTTVLSLSYGRA